MTATNGGAARSLRQALVERTNTTIHDASLIMGGRDATRPGLRNFPGWGEVLVYNDDSVIEYEEPHHIKLGELTSTAICGNDITGSCFYVTGSLAAAAGIWAPFGAVFASMTLWLFRWVYTEAVTAMPFNGGIYNVLLNTVSSKKIAGMVATLTMLSYIATCVVSALSAGAYLQTIIDPTKKNPTESGCYIIPVAVGLVVFFAILKLIGISESARVAACMFVIHLSVMGFLMLATLFSIASPVAGMSYAQVMGNLKANLKYSGAGDSASFYQGVAQKIVNGFSSAMLGVSGFESSANFVEEQAEGVFPKTLRNMWYAVSILNIVFIVECLFAVELTNLVKEKDNALAYLGKEAVGRWLEIVVSLDAFMILAAACLTSYVGIGGLASRMAGDRCLPRVFQQSDRLATVLFGSVCISLVLMLRGNIQNLSACYSFAFLTVMLLFAISNFVLQAQRPKLPRAMKNNPVIPLAAAILVSVALVGSLINYAAVIPVFLGYWLIILMLVGFHINRLLLTKGLLKVLGNPRRGCVKRLKDRLKASVKRMKQDGSVVYFTKTANICRLNKAILYIRGNEDTNHVRIVHIYHNEFDIPPRLTAFCQLLDIIYPSTKIDLVFVRGHFGAPMIMHLSKQWGIPPNLMFITCPRSERIGRRVSDLKGVRIIMGHEEETIVDVTSMIEESCQDVTAETNSSPTTPSHSAAPEPPPALAANAWHAPVGMGEGDHEDGAIVTGMLRRGIARQVSPAEMMASRRKSLYQRAEGYRGRMRAHSLADLEVFEPVADFFVGRTRTRRDSMS